MTDEPEQEEPDREEPEQEEPDAAEPSTDEATFLGLSERTLTVLLTLGALIIVTLAVYITARLLVAQGDDVPVQPAPYNSVSPGFTPVSITFFGPTTGLVSGWVPCAICEGGRSGLIARTEDRAASWSVVRETERPVLSIARVGREDQVWAAQSLCTSQAYIGCDIGYLRSRDGGRTWEPHGPPRNSILASPPPAPGPCRWDHPYPVSSSFPTEAHGWVLCSLKPTGMVEQYKGLYQTKDGGKRWVEMPEYHPVTGGRTVNPGNMPREGFPAGVSFLNDGSGWMWTHGPDSNLAVTHNGGRHWKTVWTSPDDGDVRMVSASLTAHSTGWILRRNDDGFQLLQVTMTGSGGPNWVPAETWPPPPQVPSPVPPAS